MTENEVFEKVYDPRAVEPEMYALWERSGAFRSDPAAGPEDRTFTIVVPPPNVTGALHLGHALNNTLQDILIRYHRMRGFRTLWQPGTDHAGIATQAVVERRIREREGKSRRDLGREELVKRIWQWKGEYETRIINQFKLMGCSCDWERIRFTLDEGLARAVRHQFFNLFKDGLIFRGKRLVNWDTQLQTAVSDDEVYHETVKGHFWHFKYPVLDPKPGEPEHVIIATTRPETMLGDTAVAVHPDPESFFDKQEAQLRETIAKGAMKDRAEAQVKLETLAACRASHLAQLVQFRDMALDGRKLMLPLVEREIPLIADEWADPTKGSGCVKITPAHDPNDYEVGLRRNLPMINVLTADGKVAAIVEPGGKTNPHSGDYEGLAFAADARDKVVADLEARGLLHEIEDHEVEVGHSDRSKLPIEPYLSDQWFVQTDDKVDPGVVLGDGSVAPGLAQAAMDAVNDGRVQVFPERYGKSYLDWLGEKRDWCISRQLWWGHRIPVWKFEGSTAQDRATDIQRQLDEHLERGTLARIQGPETDDYGRKAGARFRGLFSILPESDSDLIHTLEQNGFKRDEDVLDTWFSSALWPFSTLGWPEQTDHLKRHYPGSVLVTSRDIITNWVARMVMFGLYSIGEVPFHHVYIHPKILDGRGETMSKSKGNGVDPVDTIHTHGADALRYSLADLTTETQDIRMPVEYICPHCGKLTEQSLALKAEEQARKSRGQKLDRKLQPADCHRVLCAHKECGREFATQWADLAIKEERTVARETSDKFEIGRNFCNKLWNAARFAFINLSGTPCHKLDITALPPEDRWILARLSQTIRRYHQCLHDYQFSASVKELREFFWDSLCDWYIELTKPRLPGAPRALAGADIRTSEEVREPNGDSAGQVLAFCLDQVLRLWHPTIPFITERLWQQLSAVVPERGLPGVAELKTDTPLILAAFPPDDGYVELEDETIVETFAELQDATRGVRDLRSNCAVSPKERVTATVVVPEDRAESFKALSHIVRHMAGIGELNVVSRAKRPASAGSVAIRSLRIYVHDISDDKAERIRTGKALAQIEKQVCGKQSKLDNEQFLARAKPEVVAAERRRLDELLTERQALQQHLAELDE